MTKMKNDILERLFGIKPRVLSSKDSQKFNTIYPHNRPSFNRWCKELRVSSRWNR